MAVAVDKALSQITDQLIQALIEGSTQELTQILKTLKEKSLTIQHLPALTAESPHYIRFRQGPYDILGIAFFLGKLDKIRLMIEESGGDIDTTCYCQGVYDRLFSSLVNRQHQMQYNTLATSALMYAAYSNNKELVKYLLERGALINWERYEKYPVHMATARNINTVNFIEKCIPPEIQQIIKEEMLKKAKLFDALEKDNQENKDNKDGKDNKNKIDNADSIQSLIKSGINPNWRREEDSLSILEVACLKENKAILEALLNAGLKVTGQILEYAIQHKKAVSLAILAKYSKDFKELSRCLLLASNPASHSAANPVANPGSNTGTNKEGEQDEILRPLLEAKADTNLVDSSGKTLLQHSAEKGFLKTLSLLLQHKADCNQSATVSSHAGWTALHFAANNGHEPVVRQLIETKADPNVKTKRGETPSFLAVRNQHTKTVDVFSQISSPMVLFQQIVEGTQFKTQEKIKRLERELIRQRLENEALKRSHTEDVLTLIATNPKTLHQIIQSGDLEKIVHIIQSMQSSQSAQSAATRHKAQVPSLQNSPIKQQAASPSRSRAVSPVNLASPISPAPSVISPAEKKRSLENTQAEVNIPEATPKLAILFDLRAISFIHISDKLRRYHDFLRKHGAIVTLEQLSQDIEDLLSKPTSLQGERYLKQLYSDLTVILSEWQQGTFQNAEVIRILDGLAKKQLYDLCWHESPENGTLEISDSVELSKRIKEHCVREKRQDWIAWLNPDINFEIKQQFEEFLAECVWEALSHMRREDHPCYNLILEIQNKVIYQCLHQKRVPGPLETYDQTLRKAVKACITSNASTNKSLTPNSPPSSPRGNSASFTHFDSPFAFISSAFWKEVSSLLVKTSAQEKPPTEDEVHEFALKIVLQKWRDNQLTKEETNGIRSAISGMSKETLLKGHFSTQVSKEIALELVKLFKQFYAYYATESSQSRELDPGMSYQSPVSLASHLKLDSPSLHREPSENVGNSPDKDRKEKKDKNERNDSKEESDWKIFLDEQCFADLFNRFNNNIIRESAPLFYRQRICDIILESWKKEQLSSAEQIYIKKHLLKEWTDKLERLRKGFDVMMRLTWITKELERLALQKAGGEGVNLNESLSFSITSSILSEVGRSALRVLGDGKENMDAQITHDTHVEHHTTGEQNTNGEQNTSDSGELSTAGETFQAEGAENQDASRAASRVTSRAASPSHTKSDPTSG